MDLLESHHAFENEIFNISKERDDSERTKTTDRNESEAKPVTSQVYWLISSIWDIATALLQILETFYITLLRKSMSVYINHSEL